MVLSNRFEDDTHDLTDMPTNMYCYSLHLRKTIITILIPPNFDV